MRSTIARTDVSLPRLADVLDQRVGADDRAVQRIVAALAAVDRAGGVDHRDARAAVQAERRRADPRVVVAVDLARPLPAGRAACSST